MHYSRLSLSKWQWLKVDRNNIFWHFTLISSLRFSHTALGCKSIFIFFLVQNYFFSLSVEIKTIFFCIQHQTRGKSISAMWIWISMPVRCPRAQSDVFEWSLQECVCLQPHQSFFEASPRCVSLLRDPSVRYVWLCENSPERVKH